MNVVIGKPKNKLHGAALVISPPTLLSDGDKGLEECGVNWILLIFEDLGVCALYEEEHSGNTRGHNILCPP